MRLEDFSRTWNLAGSKALFKMSQSLFKRSPYQRAQAISQFLVNFRNNPFTTRLIQNAIKTAARITDVNQLPVEGTSKLRRSIIIKEYIEANERGTLVVSFENELMKIVSSPHFRQIENEYQIIFIPSWQPFYSPSLFLLAAKAEHEFFLMPSSILDMPLCEGLGPKCIGLPLHAASWVNEALYPKQNDRKDIDIVMLANFNKYKRHWRLFEALKDLPVDLKVCLAGVPIGNRTKDSVLREARAFGVDGRFQILEGLNDEEIKQLLSRSKVFCALSHKEGSYIAVAESLMAGTPVGMYDDALIGTKSYINEETGILFDPEKPLARQIMKFLETSEKLDPSTWARNNISAKVNNERLNRMLRERALSRDNPWTENLESFYSKRFDFYYYREAEAEEEYVKSVNAFAEKFELVIERPVYS
ncbi:MAG: glycosyltransferase [Tissierellales bacterium]|nr:glycosyltransferase [Tissierellales bacterium]